jgi:hypothetical protein
MRQINEKRKKIEQNVIQIADVVNSLSLWELPAKVKYRLFSTVAERERKKTLYMNKQKNIYIYIEGEREKAKRQLLGR